MARLPLALGAALAALTFGAPAASAGPCDGKSAPVPAAAPTTPLAPPAEPDPDAAPETQPDATLVPFADETWTNEGGRRTTLLEVPAPPAGAARWDRIVLTFSNRQPGDAYDRLVAVDAGGVELLRMTTPRTPYTLQRDLTEVAELFAAGEELEFGISNAAYPTSPTPAQQISTVRIDFYAGEPSARRFDRAARVVPVTNGRWSDGHGCASSARLDLGSAPAPKDALVDLTLSGHGSEEFWYCAACNNNEEIAPRSFHVLVDGQLLGRAVGVPYVYALAGFNQGANPHPSHPIVWWTAQRELDKAGVHTGVGEIPPYRLQVPADKLSLLRGQRTIELVQENGARRSYTGAWLTSVRILEDVAQGTPVPARR